MQNVYFDNAATTPMRAEVIDEIAQVLKKNYGNPSSSHSFGRSSKSLIENCRKSVARSLNVLASEIIFTSGGTEADNLILRSAVKDLNISHIITSKIEHHAVLHTVEALQKEYDLLVSFVRIDAHGFIDYNHLDQLLQSESKTLVSLMHINNEIGNILDVKRVALLCKKHHSFFHTDAVQSVGHYDLDLQDIPVDFLVASAHKFNGPKGVGFAFIRKKSELKPSLLGGEQERGLRAGTESVHNIVGLEKALKIAMNNLEQDIRYVSGIKHDFIKKLTTHLPDVTFNGGCLSDDKSSYALVNVCFPVASEKAAMFLFQLDLKGVACSKGSACQSGSSQSSHVLAEILSAEDLQKPSIRFSFGIFNTTEEVDYVVSALKNLI